jgi:transposase
MLIAGRWARGGAPRTVADQACMAAILFMVRTSSSRALLPVGEFGCGGVTTCWWRFAEWAQAGVFKRLQRLLDELRRGRGRSTGRGWRAAADRGGDRRQRERHPSVRGGPRRRSTGPHAVGAAAHPARSGPRGQGLRQCRQPGLAAAAWDPAADRSAWGGVLGAAGPAAVEGRAGAFVLVASDE